MKERKKEFENTIQPIMTKLYQQEGGGPGTGGATGGQSYEEPYQSGTGPTVDEVS